MNEQHPIRGAARLETCEKQRPHRYRSHVYLPTDPDSRLGSCQKEIIIHVDFDASSFYENIPVKVSARRISETLAQERQPLTEKMPGVSLVGLSSYKHVQDQVPSVYAASAFEKTKSSEKMKSCGSTAAMY
ncbi:hypothetical protein OIU78_005888 [Salix suchowensis]|nr:hypothetical protein OIU78_005888 [Salix suchowensis]